MEKIRKIKMFGIGFIILLLMLATIVRTLWAETRAERWRAKSVMTHQEWYKEKAWVDDPRPQIASRDPKNYLPPEVYGKVTFDVEAMKAAWAETVGFKSPDETGKIAPEIVPGTYHYTDKDKLPFKALMIPYYYEQFRPGGGPHFGNFPEVKVVPTRQYYWSLPLSRATKEKMGKTMLDDGGYLVGSSYVNGFPFPRPSGKFKAQQAIYNWLNRYLDGENMAGNVGNIGFDKNLKEDWFNESNYYRLKVAGRVTQPEPYYDERAKKTDELWISTIDYFTPQDQAGNAIFNIYYTDPNKSDQVLFYLNQVRRLRKLSGEDTQDVYPGQDHMLEDAHGFNRKLTPTRNPYKYEVIAEREYLVPSYTSDGSLFFTSGKKGGEMHNAEFERRPVIVIGLTQQSPYYLYSKTILYIDKETHMLLFVENYDRKGRLYRTFKNFFLFLPGQGMFTWFYFIGLNHVDVHSTFGPSNCDPFATWITRTESSVGFLTRKGK